MISFYETNLDDRDVTLMMPVPVVHPSDKRIVFVG